MSIGHQNAPNGPTIGSFLGKKSEFFGNLGNYGLLVRNLLKRNMFAVDYKSLTYIPTYLRLI